MAFDILPLYIRASTDCWSILFSFLTMTSGAPKSINFFNRLFLLMTLLYKSFKSVVANRPPSICIIGLSSGGITGTASIIIHDGRLLDSMRFLTIWRRFLSFITRALDFGRSLSSSWISTMMPSKSNLFNNILTASAPVLAVIFAG